MKRFFYPLTVICLLVVLLLAPGKAVAEGSAMVSDVIPGIPAVVTYVDTTQLMSFFAIRVTGGPAPEYDDDLYPGWCIQMGIYGDLLNEPATLYNSLIPANMPVDAASLPWNQINYLLNHKIRSPGSDNIQFIHDVQGALWILMGEQNLDPEYDSETARQMAEDAWAHPDYVPGPADIRAVLVYSDGMNDEDPESYQEAIFEMAAPPLDNQCNCQEEEVKADFHNLEEGAHVEGLGVVAPDLDIQAEGDVVKIVENGSANYVAYGSKADGGTKNHGLAEGGGFTNISLVHQTNKPKKPLPAQDRYTFTFADGVTVNKFSLHMLDFGDYNPSRDTNHFASMIAYAGDRVVSESWLRYKTGTGDYYSGRYGQLLDRAGDAGFAMPGDPGDWTWLVLGFGITRVELTFYNNSQNQDPSMVGGGQDPNVGFDSLSFSKCTFGEGVQLEYVTGDLQNIPEGGPAEALDAVALNLSMNSSHLDGNGTTVDDDLVKIVEDGQPLYVAYGSKINGGFKNYGLPESGGFTNISLVHNLELDIKPPLSSQSQYTFTFEDFEDGSIVTDFSLLMLDFGDYNPTHNKDHLIKMAAYDKDGKMLSESQLSYSTVRGMGWLVDGAGDAGFAGPGDPGKWTWFASGLDIKTVVLTFYNNPGGQDPNVGFDNLKFTVCQPQN